VVELQFTFDEFGVCVPSKFEGVYVKLFEGWVGLTYISAKVDEVFIKLFECGLDYILNLIKYSVFYVKLTNLLDNLSHPRTIRQTRFLFADVAQ
jgi:hypothetical protein